MQARDQLLARADDLMHDAPGRVSVRRISHIDDVRVLRQARDALTAAEVTELRSLRLELMERLDGAVAAVGPPKTQKKKGLLGALLSPLMGAARGMSAELPGGPARLPAPGELLDAGEAWIISHLVADRVEADLAVLRAPWEEASIEPVA